MVRILLLFFLSTSWLVAPCQENRRGQTADKLYGQLFIDVQMQKVFKDSKTFVDCTPKKTINEITESYKNLKNNPAVRYSLKGFVKDNFNEPPVSKEDTIIAIKKSTDIVTHIKSLWAQLKRSPDAAVATGNSLLPLSNSYIVPGGRFREIYYWDSYFTMLGLQECNDYGMIDNMIRNFSYLIQQYGHIPNGNRNYYLSRSQPPFFSSMLDLLAEKRGNVVYAQYQLSLQREYNYWMDKSEATQHVVKMPDGSFLNRYYDQLDIPRQEAFYEDSILGRGLSQKKRQELYRNLRSAAESGWDFSSRWYSGGGLASTQTVNIVPVDLNCLLYHMEVTLSKSYKETGNLLQSNYYKQTADKRKDAINKYCWNVSKGWYFDYDIVEKHQRSDYTLAGMSPFFFSVAKEGYVKNAAKVLQSRFVKPGGVVTTLRTTGQQWDAPNGWAPLQWITVKGLQNYEMETLAKDIATKWIKLNKKVYNETGKLMEKYNVVNLNADAGGGEYPTQDGFGWTNGVLLKLMNMYGE